ncbi:hypothetical protein F751_6535 [Auxenochlorella protothecoides]|uniref:Uncharacterized protein n=1 Tax=Auxenochlorella protothecoides TaxID=3075 RepID=A0A087STG2_AUXPR|nr:hypothetical protein F751_6535 [Auxenochlorella protothecoides]KFM29016.1 hypothetical protein F751_6535 [Auxenochlorella protothecoides]
MGGRCWSANNSARHLWTSRAERRAQRQLQSMRPGARQVGAPRGQDRSSGTRPATAG